MVDLERYYADKTLLVTGATGLLGKALVEAILRKLPEVDRVHLLIRPSGGEGTRRRGPEERLREEILGSTAFRRLRRLHGARFDAFVEDRLRVVEGDLASDRLGMDRETWQRLRREVDVVINCGALAVFDAPLDEALETNAVGPLRVLEFARGAPDPPFVAHVSTCYVNRLEGPAFETPLDPARAPGAEGDEPYDVDEEVRELRRRLDGLRDADDRAALGMQRARRRGWQDSYTFTKAMGEQLFTRHRGEVPGLILRPSIIESALRSPEPGWMEGFRMIDPLIVAFARGQLFEFPGNPESVLDIVPVDMVVNALLASVPWTHEGEGPEVYQVASGTESPLLLKDFRDLLEEYVEGVGSARWQRSGPVPQVTFPETERFLRDLRYRYLLPLRVAERAAAPLRLLPAGRRLHDRLDRRLGALERLQRYARIYGPYAESRARFLSFHVRDLWEALAPDQRESFPFDVGALDWRDYLHEIHLPGVERYLVGLRDDEPPPDADVDAPCASPRGEARADGTDGSGGTAPAGTAASDGTGAADDGAEPADGGDGAAAAARDGRGRWEKVERHLSLADGADAGEVHRWIAPAYKRVTRRAGCTLVRGICRFYLDLECEGRHHVPERGPFIVVCNHTSHVDTAAILAALGELAPRIHPAAATDYWFRYPWLGELLNLSIGAIPFDRRDRNVTRALAAPAEVLRQGHSVIFYPEGGRSPTGELRPFASSVGLLALATAAPIVPVHLRGAYGSLPKGEAVPKKRSLEMTFGPPRPVEPYLRRLDRESVSDLARKLADDAHAAVASLGGAVGS